LTDQRATGQKRKKVLCRQELATKEHRNEGRKREQTLTRARRGSSKRAEKKEGAGTTAKLD